MGRLLGIILICLAVGACGKEGVTLSATATPQADPLVTKAEAIFTAVREGKYEEARRDFNDQMHKYLPAIKLADSWVAFRRSFGDFKSFGSAEVLKRGSFTVVNVVLHMTEKEGQLRASFDSVGKVAGLFLLRPGLPTP